MSIDWRTATAPAITAELHRRLETRYGPPAWAYFAELRSGTGGAHRRTADAVAMGLYPSRGLELHGFEIKATRADLIREIQEPDKAAPVADFCDFWWLVLPPTMAGYASKEAPATWGILVPRSGGLGVKRAAGKLRPKPIGRPLLASILRRAHELERAPIVEAQRRGHAAGLEQGLERGRREAGSADRAERAENDLAALRRRVNDFEREARISLSHRPPAETGKTLRAVMEGKEHVARAETRLRALRDGIEAVLRGDRAWL